MKGRNLVASMSEENDIKPPRAERSPIKSDRNEDDRGDRGRERDRARRGERQSRFQPRSSSGGRSRDRGGRRAPADRRIYVSNIPYEFRWQELKDLFRTEVGEVAYVELFSDDVDKPRGCGIVEFESPDSVKKAVEKMHRFELKGRKLVVKEDFDIERDKYGRPLKGGSSGGGGGGGGGGNAGMGGGSNRPRDEPRSSWQAPAPAAGPIGTNSSAVPNKWGNTYGLSPQFLECLGINGPLVSRVFVANLDYKVDEKKLRDVFRLAGKVTNAELNRDKDGKSRGHGVVEFEHPVEAVQAISMLHNQMLYDRKMTVRMDRVNEKPEGLPSKLPEGLRGIGMGLGAGGNPLLDVSRNLPTGQQTNSVGAVAGAAAGLGAAVLPNVVSPSMGLNNTGRFSDSPPLPRRSALGYGGGAAALPVGLSVGVGNLGAIAGGAEMGGLSGGLAGGLGAGVAGGLGGGSGAYNSGIGGGAAGIGGGLGVGMSGGIGTGIAGGTNAGSYGSGGISSSGGGGSFMGGGGNSHYGSSIGGGYGSGGRDYNSSMGGLAGAYPGAVDREYHGPIYGDGPGRDIGGNNGNVRPLDTVVVKNLPPSVSWQMLRDQFRSVGDVKFAEIRNKDMGLIRFNSERDAQRAVSILL
ncbi:hypothetical protein J437_LFUL000294 [Ladona fulva]|uniref:RRM domain-containing protein n=1 Tax=Ladona fulva TaxID=123851 RepID=A0A8K0K2A4_LADFU|nr:hypothetical protein J437_LFUL000294 [Ladona fulva]